MAFSANVLLYLDDYCDVDLLEKTLNEPDSEPSHSIEKILADAVTAVSNFDADNIEGYWPCEIATPVEYILGLEKPEELVNYTNNMQAEARKAAHTLIKANLQEMAARGGNIEKMVDVLPPDSTSSYRIRSAFEILDNVPNCECCDLFLDNGLWRTFPKGPELEKIQAHPEDYAVIRILFK